MKGGGQKFKLDEIQRLDRNNHASNVYYMGFPDPVSGACFPPSPSFSPAFDGNMMMHHSLSAISGDGNTGHVGSVPVNRHDKHGMLDGELELGLCDSLHEMFIGDQPKNYYFGGSRCCGAPDDHFLNGNGNFYKNRSDYGVGGSELLRYNGCYDGDMEAKSNGFRENGNVNGGLMGSFYTSMHSYDMYNENEGFRDERDYLLPEGGGYLNFGGDESVLNLLHPSEYINAKMGLDLQWDYSILKQKFGGLPCLSASPSVSSQAKNLKCASAKKYEHSMSWKKNVKSEIPLQKSQEKKPALCGKYEYRGFDEVGIGHNRSPGEGIFERGLMPSSSPVVPGLVYGRSLTDIQGHVYSLSKDQLGCRFLQSIIDQGNAEDVQIIFAELIDHVVELMMDPFGNYLMQKLWGVCTEEQRKKIVQMVTNKPGELIRISLDTHGTRVVQKLIETVKSKKQISLLMIALRHGFVELMKDVNGNHVVQRCLQCLNKEHNKFIFDAAAKFGIEIATHRHGCCVLNQCISRSSGIDREKLVAEISENGFLLAQDAFGNYVVQYIIELQIPSVAVTLLSQFEGHYVYLSKQKFSSHVVEKCLKYFEESRTRIIHEFLSEPHFDQLLQDPFANYVIQRALEVTKGPLRAILARAVRSYTILRTSPYCKKLFSSNLLK